MRRISDLISYAPAALLAIAVVSTAAEWGRLMEAGGWFAALGHFLMVAATLVLLYLAGVLALILAALPFVFLFARNEDDLFALVEAGRDGISPLALLGVCRAISLRLLFAILNPPWKALWWCWWYIRGSVAHVRSR